MTPGLAGQYIRTMYFQATGKKMETKLIIETARRFPLNPKNVSEAISAISCTRFPQFVRSTWFIRRSSVPVSTAQTCNLNVAKRVCIVHKYGLVG